VCSASLQSNCAFALLSIERLLCCGLFALRLGRIRISIRFACWRDRILNRLRICACSKRNRVARLAEWQVTLSTPCFKVLTANAPRSFSGNASEKSWSRSPSVSAIWIRRLTSDERWVQASSSIRLERRFCFGWCLSINWFLIRLYLLEFNVAFYLHRNSIFAKLARFVHNWCMMMWLVAPLKHRKRIRIAASIKIISLVTKCSYEHYFRRKASRKVAHI